MLPRQKLHLGGQVGNFVKPAQYISVYLVVVLLSNSLRFVFGEYHIAFHTHTLAMSDSPCALASHP